MDELFDDLPPSPPWSVIEFSFSCEGTDAEIVVMCNYRRFIISAHKDNFSQSPALKSKYLFFLEVAENYELDGYTLEDFYNWIIEPLLPKLEELPEITTSLTLQHFLFPKTEKYVIRGYGEELAAERCNESEDNVPIFGIQLPEEVCVPWPQYNPKDIQLPEKRNIYGPPSYIPSKVHLKGGRAAFFKPMRPGDDKRFIHELNTYQSIHEAHLDESLRISRLLGLVRNETGQVFGLLLTYIDCGHGTLLCAVKPDITSNLRQK
ncbi:hypothetical protein F53441_5944 [Fusarium austroafricanum]|uniref:Uncharacterized protein n=1 Tax=Fusarium austroafricanum TaxID=2364996 RepID=A0A8H4KGW7_9HYPO|nr:hypothetical protein F53441_5944 [Fusarium austroafricanum]